MGYAMVVIHFSPLNGGQLHSEQISWSQCVLYTEISLYNINTCRTQLSAVCMNVPKSGGGSM